MKKTLPTQNSSSNKKIYNNVRILQIEVSPISQLLINSALSNKAAQISIANNNKSAIGLLAQNNYDLILINSLSLNKLQKSLVKKNQPYFNTPIIALGELNTPYLKLKVQYLPKPFTPHELTRAIEQQLQNNSDIYDFSITSFSTYPLHSISNNNSVIVNSTLKLLATTLNDDIRAFNSALEDRQYNQLKNLAHKIKPNFHLIGLENLQSICSSIENSTTNKTTRNLATKLIDLIPSIITKIKIELKNHE